MRDTIPPKIIVCCHKLGEALACVDWLKSLERELKSLDYLSTTQHVSSMACGSPMQGSHLFTFFLCGSQKSLVCPCLPGTLWGAPSWAHKDSKTV